MRSYTSEFSSRLVRAIKKPAAPRIAALAVVAVVAGLMGPPGLAVGPTQSHTNTPALPTGAAMEASAVLSAIPISTDFVRVISTLTREHASYPKQIVGPLRFPAGAIDVPWLGAPERAVPQNAAVNLERGNSVSTPRASQAPRLQLASLGAPATGLARPSHDAMRSMVSFDPRQSDLNGEAEDVLDAVADGLAGNVTRIQLLAYGGGAGAQSHTERRLALRRALAVRNHLMSRGISQDRITVRAMGSATDGGFSDRVDIVFPAS